MISIPKRYLLIDGRNLLWRAAYTHPSLSVKGVWTGAAFGFMVTLLSIHKRYRGKTIVVWEGSQNFRRRLFPDYKPHPTDKDSKRLRKDVEKQERVLIEILQLAGITQYRPADGEADDAMGTIALTKLSKFPESEVTIYSGDSDLRQLVRPGVRVIAPGQRGEEAVYDTDEAVVKKHGCTPGQIPVLKSLAGDASDGIPGLKGIGPKTACKIIQGETPPRFEALVSGSRKELALYEDLATIRTDRELIKIPPTKDRSKLSEKLRVYRFRSLTRRTKEILALRRS